MSVLVTGAAGFIGSHLVERLLDEGTEVVGLDNFDAFYDAAVKERNLERARDHAGFVEVRGDIRDPGAYERLPDGIDTVVHLAALAGVRPSIRDPHGYFDVNVRGTLVLLDFMKSRKIPRLHFGSSSSVYGNSAPVPFREDDAGDRPISPYAATKRAGELIVHAHGHLYGIDAVCLRFFTVYGPRQRPDLAIHTFSRRLADGQPIQMYGDGTSERDYTYVDDILDGVRGAMRYLEASPGTYEIVNLGGARTITLRDMIVHVATALGVSPRIETVCEQAGDVRRTFADVSKAERLFGYRPSVPFEEGTRRFAEWFLSERAAAGIFASDSASSLRAGSNGAAAVAYGVAP
ncbi:MAG: NAD-dependent epimerase/dehydratase family protein [Gemmatimonadales bacterium]